MKKLIAVFLIVTLLNACSSPVAQTKEESSTTESKTPATAEEKTNATYPVASDELIEFADRLIEGKESVEAKDFKPTKGFMDKNDNLLLAFNDDLYDADKSPVYIQKGNQVYEFDRKDPMLQELMYRMGVSDSNAESKGYALTFGTQERKQKLPDLGALFDKFPKDLKGDDMQDTSLAYMIYKDGEFFFRYGENLFDSNAKEIPVYMKNKRYILDAEKHSEWLKEFRNIMQDYRVK